MFSEERVSHDNPGCKTVGFWTEINYLRRIFLQTSDKIIILI